MAAVVVAAAVAAFAAGSIGIKVGIPATINHRGRRTPAVLGIAAAIPVAIGFLVSLAALAGGVTPAERAVIGQFGGALAVVAAGLYDDLQPVRTRGLMRQLRMALSGRIPPGVVKLVAISAAAGLVVLTSGGTGAGVLILGVPVIAGCANLWNLLDVRPGRSVKFFIPAVVAVMVVQATGGGEWTLADRLPLAPLVAAGAIGIFPLDVRERGMLGDSGSNLLGFVVGIGLFLALSKTGMAIALAVLVALHVLSETATLSRPIRAFPPLRWLDELGRPEEPPPVAPIRR
jgi:UDP-GlcNAc:undecaprenyl-phosphate/decaprenyl-phosphate GlcNAc-1-phosphate transferase